MYIYKGDNVKVTTMTPENYECHPFNRLTGTGGGICFFNKKCIKTKPIRITLYKSFEVVKIDLKLKCSHIIIFCVYRPPPSKKNKFTPAGFLDEFEHFLDNHFSYNAPTIILGDINFHYDCPDEFYVLKMYDVLKLL